VARPVSRGLCMPSQFSRTEASGSYHFHFGSDEAIDYPPLEAGARQESSLVRCMILVRRWTGSALS